MPIDLILFKTYFMRWFYFSREYGQFFSFRTLGGILPLFLAEHPHKENNMKMEHTFILNICRFCIIFA